VNFQTQKGYSIAKYLIAITGTPALAAKVIDKYIDTNYNVLELKVWGDLMVIWALLVETRNADAAKAAGITRVPLGEQPHNGDSARSNPHQYRRLTLVSGGIEKKDS
jgi:hypothetical protein